MIPFRILIFVFAILTGMITSYSVFAQESTSPPPGKDTFDRLDGTGSSKKRVDVIEWEGNLEVHVYPKGSLKGLSAKLDDRNQGQKVMVIGYRFEGMKVPLIRRAVLGIHFDAKIKSFLDPSEKDFDKLAISNQDLDQPWIRYKLDLPPKNWYPEGDPRNDETNDAPGIKMGQSPHLNFPALREPASDSQ